MDLVTCKAAGFGDATQFNFDIQADIVLTETTNDALSREPQVRISMAHMKRKPKVTLILLSISINLELIDAQERLCHFPP